MAEVTKSEGFTRSERYLSKLCNTSFLSLWSYPNVFRSAGKELCDVLVIFGDDVLLFSDKECKYPDTGNSDLDWRRWYRKAILKSADQLRRAEEWIRNHSDRVYLDPKCINRFPLPIPGPPKIRVHRIIVATGAAERCRREHGGSGSLILHPLAKCSNDDTPDLPFCVGPLSMLRGIAHVFDEVTLPTVLKELDTVSDFVKYLSEKEGLLETQRILYAPGEEEMLGWYLHGGLSKGDSNRFLLPDEKLGGVALYEGFWEALITDERYLQRKDAEVPSYRWDKIIEQFNGDILGDRMAFGNENGVAGHESRVRLLASANRETRRLLILALADFFLKAHGDEVRFRIVMPRTQAGTGYVFLQVPIVDELMRDAYRRMRGDLLFAYVGSCLKKYSDLEAVVGLATEPRQSDEGHSEDVMAIAAQDWTPEHEARLVEALARAPVPVFTRVKEHAANVSDENQFEAVEDKRALRNRRKRDRKRRR